MKALFLKVQECLVKFKVPYAVVGGYAVVMHGVVRGTVDLDIVIRHSKAAFVNLENALRSIGFVPRLPVTAEEIFEFREEYITNRNLIAWSFVNPSMPLEIVNIILTTNESDLNLTKKRMFGKMIPIVSIEDLILMKEHAARPQDLEDVKALKAIQKLGVQG